jgi:dihydropyrimidinase
MDVSGHQGGNVERDGRVVNLETVVRGGSVVLPHCCEVLDIGIRDGKIAALAAPGFLPTAPSEITAADRYVLPGAIDPHTHVHWPFGKGLRTCDTFRSATEAAAVAGTTTIIDFVPQSPIQSHFDAAQVRLEEAVGQSAVDFSFHPMLKDASAQTLREIPKLADAGMTSFKIFTAIEGMRLDDGEVQAAMEVIADVGGLAAIHAENEAVVRRAVDQTVATEGTSIAAFPRSRPAIAEAAAIELVALYARLFEVPIYILHVTARESLAAVRDARSRGTLLRAETCTHYLVFDDSAYGQPNGWMYVILPPIRTPDDRDALWEALRDRTLECVGSDHCAYALNHKQPGFSDFRVMPGGAPGLAARVPILWSEAVSRGRLSPHEYGRATALGPAQTLGLYPRKGVIRVGSDADLVVFDPKRKWSWPLFDGHSGSDWDPYDAIEGTGAPAITLLRGRIVAADGKFVGNHNGEFLRRKIDASYWSET